MDLVQLLGEAGLPHLMQTLMAQAASPSSSPTRVGHGHGGGTGQEQQGSPGHADSRAAAGRCRLDLAAGVWPLFQAGSGADNTVLFCLGVMPAQAFLRVRV